MCLSYEDLMSNERNVIASTEKLIAMSMVYLVDIFIYTDGQFFIEY